MANAKKIILGSSLVLAGICSANANTLFQTTELGNTSMIQSEMLNISAQDAEALRVAELCCGYGAHLTSKQIKHEIRMTKKEQKKDDRAQRIAVRKEAKSKSKDAIVKR